MNWYYIIAACVGSMTLLGTVLAAGIAWGMLTQRQKSHEEHDDERYAETSAMLREMRDDIKTLLTTH